MPPSIVSLLLVLNLVFGLFLIGEIEREELLCDG
jgi:hypothetical protein